jgi:hypothetical protein
LLSHDLFLSTVVGAYSFSGDGWQANASTAEEALFKVGHVDRRNPHMKKQPQTFKFLAVSAGPYRAGEKQAEIVSAVGCTQRARNIAH